MIQDDLHYWERLLIIAYLKVAQAAMNVAASLGAISAPLIIGALTKANPHRGWRNFYVRIPSSTIMVRLLMIF